MCVCVCAQARTTAAAVRKAEDGKLPVWFVAAFSSQNVG